MFVGEEFPGELSVIICSVSQHFCNIFRSVTVARPSILSNSAFIDGVSTTKFATFSTMATLVFTVQEQNWGCTHVKDLI